MAAERVVVTGGAGGLGRVVVERLAARHAVTVLDIVESPALPSGVRYVKGNITDYDCVRGVLAGHDTVVHLAAIPNPRTAPAPFTFNTNVQGAWVVMQAAEDAGVRRVAVASSDSVFGLSYNPPDWPPRYLPVDEEHPCRPTEFYSLSKWVTETIAQSYAARGKLEVLVIRPVHILFPAVYPEIATRGADPQNYHFWAYVAPEDAAQAFERTTAIAYPGYNVFAIAAAEGLNTRPTLEMARERWGANMPPVKRPEVYAANPLASIVGIGKARKMLGYEPKVTWRELVARQTSGG